MYRHNPTSFYPHLNLNCTDSPIFFFFFLLLAINLEGVSGKFSDLEICKFREPADITSCKVFCDGDHGGYSTCSLTLDPSGQFARFSGNISIDIPPNREDIQRSGYAAWRTKERGGTLFSFGARNWDIDPYTWLALRVKSDGASYYVNLQTDGIVPTDIHQHRLFAKRPGEWENIYVWISCCIFTPPPFSSALFQ